MKKICIITCYSQPDYVRAKTLRAAVSSMNDRQLIVVKNTNKGIIRYLEVLIKTLLVRIRHNPDIFILTFRGYELLLPMRIVTIGKPFIFDEFINLIEWLVYEHKRIKAGSKAALILTVLYRFCLRIVDGILTDTHSHADLSSEMMGIPRSKYYVVTVGTDEEVFSSLRQPVSETFTVFYYGNMLPLHGLRYVIEAAKSLQDTDMKFVLIGGNKRTGSEVEKAMAKGANIEYRKWVDFDELPGIMTAASLCLAGPFGGTFQAQHVITGKEFQYLAMKRPTVVGRNKESKVFSDKKNAIIVEQGSAKALEEAIRWAYENQNQLEHIAKAGNELYKSEFSNLVITRQLRFVFSSLHGEYMHTGVNHK